jgi:hypothetical protein
MVLKQGRVILVIYSLCQQTHKNIKTQLNQLHNYCGRGGVPTDRTVFSVADNSLPVPAKASGHSFSYEGPNGMYVLRCKEVPRARILN